MSRGGGAGSARPSKTRIAWERFDHNDCEPAGGPLGEPQGAHRLVTGAAAKSLARPPRVNRRPNQARRLSVTPPSHGVDGGSLVPLHRSIFDPVPT